VLPDDEYAGRIARGESRIESFSGGRAQGETKTGGKASLEEVFERDGHELSPAMSLWEIPFPSPSA
jgi:hypothetical protein